MNHPMSRNKEEEREFRMQNYEFEKEDLIDFYKSQKWPQEGLKRFLVNSLNDLGYEEFLKEDGLI